MTFSIVARSDDGRSWGVAVASKFLAVGAAVPAVQAGVGAVATQSYANLTYRPEGLRLMSSGLDAAAALAALTGADPGAAQRQAGLVDAAGTAATFTGPGCHAWAGGRAGGGYAVQGNMLAGPEVVDAIERTWSAAAPSTPLAERLVAALTAGDAAGGDRRGRQSAAVLVASAGAGYGGGSDVELDLRVDDHAEPLPELARLLGLHRLYFGRPDPATLLPLHGELADEVRRALTRLGHTADDLDAALAGWAGVENYEERIVDGSIDPLVLEQLREAARRG